MSNSHVVKWHDAGREPQCPSNPAYPKGIDVDVTAGARPACDVALPYPARRCGHFDVICRVCGYRAVITTAGRPDDPRSAKLPCQGRAARQN